MRIKRLIPCGILTYLLSAYLPVSIHPIAVQDFKVNSDTAEGIAQDWPDIAFDSLGNFVIVYCDKGVDGDFRQIYFQRFDSQANRLGVPVLVSDTTLRTTILPPQPCTPRAGSSSPGALVHVHPNGTTTSKLGGTILQGMLWISGREWIWSVQTRIASVGLAILR